MNADDQLPVIGRSGKAALPGSTARGGKTHLTLRGMSVRFL